MVAVKLAPPRKRLSRAECTAVLAHWYTGADEGRHIEIINGERKMPTGSFAHGFSTSKLSRLLGNFIDDMDLGFLVEAPYSVIIKQDFVAEPDMMFIRKERASIIKKLWVEEPPDLIVEVLSPSTESYDRREKFIEYAKFGVPSFSWLNRTTRPLRSMRIS